MSALRQRHEQKCQSETVATTNEISVRKFKPTNFSSLDLLNAVPKHCFERSALTSSLYLLGDVLMLAILCVAVTLTDRATSLPSGVKLAAWIVYWTFSGFIGTGIWVIAHECGHQAFSTSKTLNDAVGLVFHSLLLVPYHSWRISHARHHTGTNHLTREEVFVPRTRSDFVTDGIRGVRVGGMELEELIEEAPMFRFAALLAQQLVGWPMYLCMNVAGQKHLPKGTNHFNPSSRLFQPRQKGLVITSDIALLVVIGLLHTLRLHIGWIPFVKYYLFPYFLVNHWLVMIVYLQHTDPAVPHYSAKQWTLARGALSTIDRKLMGPLGRIFFHSICETHVAHHVCVRIPHYHAMEATIALRELLGDDYRYTDENMFVSLWKNYRACRFIEDEGDVLFYKNGAGKSEVEYVWESSSDSGVELCETCD